jgi:tetratricopeptide (TPR) repeat protein
VSDSKRVNELRKAGNLKDALDLARRIIRQDPYDIWNIRAYGWALHDAIKVTSESDLATAQKLVAEFNQLDIPEDEELLLSRRKYFSGLSDPSFRLVQEARAKSKNKQYGEALRLYRQAVKQYPDSKDACEGMAWELWRALRDLPKEAPSGDIARLLREYAGLKAVEKPSEIHSRMLAAATWVADRFPNYIRFVRWWDVANLRYEDRQRQYSQKDGKYYDSLTEKLIKSLHRAGKNHDDPSDFEWISKFFGDRYQEFPEQEWFPYYYGKALVRTGDLEAARRIVLPIVRAKQTEFWAWDVLADTFTDSENRIACLGKALLCKVKSDSFRVNVHLELAKTLIAEQAFPEAKREILSAIEIREKEGWKVGEDLQRIQQQEWFPPTTPTGDNRSLYESVAKGADAILTASLPWVDAVITGRREARDDKKPLLFVGTISQSSLDEVPVKPSKFPQVQNLPVGSPVRLKSDTFGDRKIIVALEPRTGTPWDILPAHAGVVTHVNVKRGVATVRLVASQRDICLLHFDRFPEAKELTLGDFVELKMRKDTKRNRDLAVSFLTVNDLPVESPYYIRFSGSIRIDPGNAFGFIDNDDGRTRQSCYVSPDFVTHLSLSDGDHVAVAAVCEWNERKHRYSWTAVEVEAV